MISSWLLVAGQMILIALLASPVKELYQGSATDLLGVSLVVLSVIIALWAYVSMRAGTFTVMPEPTSSATLTQAGPYRYVRHPMYSAVIIGGLGAAISHADVISLVQLLALTGLLIVKLVREEHYLSKRYPDYAEYKNRTSAIVPLVY